MSMGTIGVDDYRAMSPEQREAIDAWLAAHGFDIKLVYALSRTQDGDVVVHRYLTNDEGKRYRDGNEAAKEKATVSPRFPFPW